MSATSKLKPISITMTFPSILKIGIISAMAIFVIVLGKTVTAFHLDDYQPRVPIEILEDVQEIESPYPVSENRINKGREIFFGKGLCVICHGKDGKGVKTSGHPPRNFTDKKWQDLRTDGELIWVLKNGSPGTRMPIRVGKVLTEEEGWNVIQYIRTFNGK